MALQVDPTLPQSSFPYEVGLATPGTPTGSNQVITKSGPIGKRGPLYLRSASGDLVLTLAAPIAGSPANGGEDNIVLEIINADGRYHTITTPTNAVNGAAKTITFHDSTSPPTVERVLPLRAYGGVWYCNSDGVTLSA